MNYLKKVTIIGIFFAVSLFLLHCSPVVKQAPVDSQAEIAQAEARRAEAMENKLLEGIRLYETGDLDQAQAIIDQVLQAVPNNPRALEYQENIKKSPFCTVYPGDTLSEIASYYYEDKEKWPIVARANRIKNPLGISVYARLRVPWFPEVDNGKDEVGRLQKRFFGGKPPLKIVIYPVKEGDSLQALAKTYYGKEKLGYFLADYNHLENLDPLETGAALKIPVFPKQKTVKRQTDQDSYQRAVKAIKKKDYKSAYQYLTKVSRKSSVWPEAKKALAQCRTEGISYYETMGDQALEASDPKKACRYWQMGLVIDPANTALKEKIAEGKDLIKTLEMLPDLP